MVLKKKSILLIIALMFGVFLCACSKNNDPMGASRHLESEMLFAEEKTKTDGEDAAEQMKKGYDLPVDEAEREEARTDCERVMELVSDIYEHADKGQASNVVLSDDTILKMQNKIKETGCPVSAMVLYSNMENHKKMDDFLKECLAGKSSSIVLYEIRSDGAIGRMKYSFDGTLLYVLSTNTVWNQENKPGNTYSSYTRIKEWRYTEKGWFCYERCVPEYPDVTEVVDGSHMIRIEPMTEEQREMSVKYVLGLGYQGNNLLCSDWDTDHLDQLDYNGMYEYLYGMKYHERFPSEKYSNGIPKEEFENLIMQYLPVTAQQIQKYAVFDEEKQTYTWVPLGCLNYIPHNFGSALPEVTKIKENEDATVTLTVDAVSNMGMCDDAVITHELTIRFFPDGSYQYLGNKILNNGIQNIPDYQYRIKEV